MKNKSMKISWLLFLLTIAATVNLFAQSAPPLVYSVENTGADFPRPVMVDDLDALPFIQQLPDPFAWADGSGRSTNFADWEKRRNEIKAMIEHYEIGTKPDRPENITATFSADSVLTVKITVNGETLTLTSKLILPKGGGKFPAVIGIAGGSGSLPASIFSSRNIAQIPFDFSQVMAHQQNRGSEPINKLYPELRYMGAYSAWSWGISRLIDGLEIALADKIDLSHLAVTGCSFAGKMALFAGAFDERIALTIAQESGGGGYTAWRVSETLGPVENLGSTDYHWFIEDMRKFAGNNVPKLPIDHHELMAMVAPRALLVTGNEGWEWLADRSGYVASRAAKKVYETFGIGDRFGLINLGGHMHCSLPDTEQPYVEAFVEKFLLDNQTVNTEVFVYPSSYSTTNYKFWMSDWSGEASTAASEETWREAESDCVTIGSDFSIGPDAEASNGKYITTATGYNDAAPGKNGLITIPFTTKDHGKQSVFLRLNAANASYWISLDNRPFQEADNLSTNGAWQWKSIGSEDLLAGNHTLVIGAAEAGAKLDRIYITNGTDLPTGTGGVESECLKQVSSIIFDFETGNLNGWTKKNNGNGITVTQEDKHGGEYAMKIVNGTSTDYWSSQIETPITDIVAGHAYKVSFWARAVGGGATGRISTQNANQLGGQYWNDFTVSDQWTEIIHTNLTALGTTVGLDFDMGKTPGKTIYIDDIEINDLDATAIVPVKNSNVGYSLEQNYPNPFDKQTHISFEIKNNTHVSLNVYDATGRKVAELAGKEYPQGKHTVAFAGKGLSKGIYFYVLRADDFTANRKMMVK